MNNEIDLKYYDIADEYSTESAKPVSDEERDAWLNCWQSKALIVLLSAITISPEVPKSSRCTSVQPGNIIIRS